jgi:hypothetical protein
VLGVAAFVGAPKSDPGSCDLLATLGVGALDLEISTAPIAPRRRSVALLSLPPPTRRPGK